MRYRKVIRVETLFVMFGAKKNEPFSICDDFSNMVSDTRPDSELVKKYEAGKTKATQIIKDEGNQCSVLKKSNVRSMNLRKRFGVVIHNFGFVSSSLSSCHAKVTEGLRV